VNARYVSKGGACRPLFRRRAHARAIQTVMLGLGLVGGVASADGSIDDPKRLFEVSSLSIDSKARTAIEGVEKGCQYSMMSRIGPRPGELARCNQAEQKALSYGPAAARAAIARLDEPRVTRTAQWRLYDVIARAGDVELVEPLIAGLAKLERLKTSPRQMEAYRIVTTLEGITHAGLREQVPWTTEGQNVLDGKTSATWRDWLTTHRGKTRGELLGERMKAARAQLTDGDLATAFLAARFVASQPGSRLEGQSAMTVLLKREHLSQQQRQAITYALQSIPKTEAKEPVADLDSDS
jgi:hypothetical protein